MTPTGQMVILHLIIQVELFPCALGKHHKTVGLNSPTRNKAHRIFFSQIHNLLSSMAIYTGNQTGHVSVMVRLFEPQSTVATRANFCVLILEKKKKIYIVRVYQVISSGRSEKRKHIGSNKN